MWTKSAVALLLLLFLSAGAAAAGEPRIDFPVGYAKDFTNYLSLDRTQNPDQVIRLFGNDKALAGAGADGALPHGSVLVAEIYAARKDAEGNVVTSALGHRIKDRMAAIAVMEKQPGWGEGRPAGLKTGDWDFAVFSPAGERLDKDLNACRACHAPLGERDFVFSYEHLVGHAQ